VPRCSLRSKRTAKNSGGSGTIGAGGPAKLYAEKLIDVKLREADERRFAKQDSTDAVR
jgi:hypothetical protein